MPSQERLWGQLISTSREAHLARTNKSTFTIIPGEQNIRARRFNSVRAESILLETKSKVGLNEIYSNC